ncbi:MAG: hypothetical protein OXB84_01360 [Halobacteriovoraceae bacterium]|nr:hypothetical protein [Halobacteriovoraceae bacterium]
MMTVHFTCKNCGSGVHVHPNKDAGFIQCDVCGEKRQVGFSTDHAGGVLRECPECGRKDFYCQRDFNRKIGVFLFVIASILSIFTYGISLVVLWLVDMFLFKRLAQIAICYKCQTIFRGVDNIGEIRPFDHEMNDRIVYSNADFKGNPIS